MNKQPSQTGDSLPSQTNETGRKCGTREMDKDVSNFKSKKRAELRAKALDKKREYFKPKHESEKDILLKRIASRT